MSMSGDQQSHVCSFCGRRTYACVSVPGGIACPSCKRRIREERCEKGLDKPLPNCECARCRKPRVKPVVPETPKPVEPDPPPPRMHDCTCVRGMDGPDPSCPAHGDPMPDPGSLYTGNRISFRGELDFSQARAGSRLQAERGSIVQSGDDCALMGRPTEEYGAVPRPLTPPPEWDQPLPELSEPDEEELADRRMFEVDCGANPEVAARYARIARVGRDRAALQRRLFEETSERWPDTREIWVRGLAQLARIGRRGG